MHDRTLGATLLITGTCIGAGMLGLPVSMAHLGFLYSTLVLLVFWVTMLITALYVLEVVLECPEDANFISMAKVTLGRGGEVVAWIVYVLLLYSLMAAYLSAGGDMVDKILRTVSDIDLSAWIDPLPWIIIAGFVIYSGTRFVDGLNRILMAGLVVTYFMLVFSSVPHLQLARLTDGNYHYLFTVLPVVSTAFGYHVIVPSLRNYLHGDAPKLVRAIIIGSAIPLVVYLIWTAVVFTILPATGENSLIEVLQSGEIASSLTDAISAIVQNHTINLAIVSFVFFAIASSFIGIALSLFDFLRDALNLERTHHSRLFAAGLTFLPPLTYALLFPKGFLLALSYAGVFVAILHGLLPATMVWAGRRRGNPTTYRAPGGMVFLMLIVVLSLAVIAAQFS